MSCPEIVTQRRRILCAAISTDGGAYILPEANRQPDPALAIASIRHRGIVAIGRTEAEAQADYFRQSVAIAAANAAAAAGGRA